jgi:hypothetical protein
MRKSKLYSPLLLLTIVAASGCGYLLNPVAPGDSMPMEDRAHEDPLFPPGSMLESITLHVHANNASGHVVSLHPITSVWEEETVTWNSFGAAFDELVVDSITVDLDGWHVFDVKELVLAWAASERENHGILLKHSGIAAPRTLIPSRESDSNRPFLEVRYRTASGSESRRLDPQADSFIWKSMPWNNYGGRTPLYAGFAQPQAGLEMQTMIQFDVPPLPDPASLGDRVWLDVDADGLQEDGEPGVPEVAVHLHRCDDSLVATEYSDSAGAYAFLDLDPGDYYLRFELPANHAFSPRDQGSDDLVDSDADPGTGMTSCFALADGEANPAWDAGVFPVPTEAGCTRGLGYWKNHAGLGNGNQSDEVSVLLPISLGDTGGAASLSVDTAVIAVDVLGMRTYGTPRNGITKLYAHLLTAKLNIAAGANDGDVADTIAAIDAFLAENDYTAWTDLDGEARQQVASWKSDCESYNSGVIGPGACDESEGDEDD